MITEFGVPAALGIAHLGPLGRDQGDHSEQEAGRIDADMLRDIADEGFAGGVLFEWVDEWFKLHLEHRRTWSCPHDRRQLWRNVLTNEEFFGLTAAEPGSKPVVVLDGTDEEWELERQRGDRGVAMGPSARYGR